MPRRGIVYARGRKAQPGDTSGLAGMGYAATADTIPLQSSSRTSCRDTAESNASPCGRTICHSKGYAAGDVHANTVEYGFSLLKRGIVGMWHKVGAKHLPAYLDEMCFRFNNRRTPYVFRDTMLKLIDSPNLEYKQLTAKIQDAA